MRVLVTGGAGYIGSIVAQQLLARGDDVTVLDSLYRGHRAAIPEGAAFEQVDLLDVEATRRAVDQGFDGVLHFAALALVGESVANPERYYHGNVVASLHLLDAMRAAGVKRLVFSSTCATYGEPETVPISEDEPPSPVNAYGNSKLAVDRMLADEARAHGLGAVSLRYFNVGGAQRAARRGPRARDAPDPARPARRRRARREHVSIFGTDYPTQDGTAIRDYIHVDDLARAHLLALDAIAPGRHEIYNLGTGTGYSVREVIDTARAVTGREIPFARRPAAPATRRGWWPPTPRSATASAGSRSERSRT